MHQLNKPLLMNHNQGMKKAFTAATITFVEECLPNMFL